MKKNKFRAWDEETQKMYCGNDVITTFSGELEEVYIRNKNIVDELIDYKLMQYTGIKDMYGNEIYEEDIVISESMGPECGLGCIFKGVVKFYDGTFYIDNEESEIGIPLFNETNGVKVVGNIYQ